MTLNQVINRIKILATAHKQLNHFDSPGDITDALNDKTIAYPACLCMDIPGANIDVVGKTVTFALRLFFLDLVNVSQSTKANEQDVQSDMLSIAMDFLAQMDYSGYTDWKINGAAPVIFLVDTENDRLAGVTADINIVTPWTKDICAVPANSFTFPIIDAMLDGKPTYDYSYTATGDEGSTLTIATIAGKRILLILRESYTLYKVSVFDDTNKSTQYKWENSDNPLVNINLGLEVSAGERFLILYRTI